MRKTIKNLQDALLEPERVYQPTLDEAVAWYKLLNKLIFKNTLPKHPVYDFIFEVVPLRTSWGYAARYSTGMLEIQITNSYPRIRTFLEVLAHEMIHLYQLKYESGTVTHGPTFWAWKENLAEYHLGLATRYSRK
jgi:hypothetical protein